ncbi:hypothetical protein [Prevotellamassilia timonensis]|uniref:hypothetical protein n=1 Tax=Prevotellamassilia timonensis TaxID=1852370 RepID=UPI003076D366
MKKITTFLALLLTCIIGATAADFVPKDGTKYLIKCKGNSNVVYTPENSNILQAQQEVTDASYFTIESKVVENVTYFYIHPAGDATKYVYITQAPSSTNNDANDGIVGVTGSQDDATCLWKIAFNTNTSAFNITPKGYDECSWNCRSKGIGYWTTRYKNNEPDNSWYITPNVVLNGYYTIKNTATDRRTNLYNDFGVDKITRAAENLPTTLTNNYVWHVTTANNNVLTVLNGQGTPLYHDGNASLPTLKVAYSDGTKYYFGEALNCGNSGRNYKLTLWTDGDYSVADNQWTFAPVDASNIYNVVCNIEGGYVTYSATSEKAKNGGFFFISSTPEVANFTAATVDYYEPATVSIDGNNIKVNYAYDMAAVKQLANEALAKTGVGYPTADAATRTALATAVAGTDAAAIVTALNAFKNDKTSIQMPEDGKAYVITNIHKTGGKRYMKYKEDGTSMIARDDAAALPIEATYICHKVGDKYVFANNSGTYLTWRGNATGDCTNSNKGYTTSYNADYNTFTVAANPNVFGCLSFGAKRGNEESTSQSYYIVTKTGSFEKAGLDNYYDDNSSSAFTFEEVTYPNTIKFNAAQNINGVRHIATFSAPFATIIPTGVKAYYVSAKGTEATMTAIDAKAIPANQGVILTSESDAAVTMVPAAGETVATITGNQLGNSAGADKTLTAGEGYILGNGTEGTAFYPCKAGSLPSNKAYLLGNGQSAIVMNFGNAVTGINTIAAPASAKAPIFDLSGRRVVKATKGLYIQNGKKVIVK